jgi:ceramide glucosyltransferase
VQLLPHSPTAHTILIVARNLAGFVCLTATVYYAIAIRSAREFFRRDRRGGPPFAPPITILKPMRGLDPEAYENFASFCRQNYPRYQILFGAESADDPAIAVARRVAADFPSVDIGIVVGKSVPSANRKVACLAGMLPQAKYGLLLVSDSDIRVEPDFLSRIVEPMAEPGIGVVTCLYRSHSSRFAGGLFALGLSTDFAPSVLVGRKLEGVSFGMGSGILIRRPIVSVLGGFEAFGHVLADDYQLGNLPARAGHRVELARCVVDHRVGTNGLRDLVDHQLRWNRGTRAVRPVGYFGLVLFQGVPAALLLLALGGGGAASVLCAGATIAMRLVMAWYVAVRCLGERWVTRRLALVPLRDLFGLAMWIGGFFGNSVVWRGRRYRLEQGGRLVGDGPSGADRARLASPSAVGHVSARLP